MRRNASVKRSVPIRGTGPAPPEPVEIDLARAHRGGAKDGAPSDAIDAHEEPPELREGLFHRPGGGGLSRAEHPDDAPQLGAGRAHRGAPRMDLRRSVPDPIRVPALRVREVVLVSLVAAREVQLVEAAFDREPNRRAEDAVSGRRAEEAQVERGLVPDEALAVKEAVVVRDGAPAQPEHGEDNFTGAAPHLVRAIRRAAAPRDPERAGRLRHRPAFRVLAEEHGQLAHDPRLRRTGARR